MNLGVKLVSDSATATVTTHVTFNCSEGHMLRDSNSGTATIDTYGGADSSRTTDTCCLPRVCGNSGSAGSATKISEIKGLADILRNSSSSGGGAGVSATPDLDVNYYGFIP